MISRILDAISFETFAIAAFILGLFIALSVMLWLASYAYKCGRRDCLVEHFSFTLRPDDSTKNRL